MNPSLEPGDGEGEAVSYTHELFGLIGDVARRAAYDAGAVEFCRVHKAVMVYKGDFEADRLAYAYANMILSRVGLERWRPDVMDAVEDELALAAERRCPFCPT